MFDLVAMKGAILNPDERERRCRPSFFTADDDGDDADSDANNDDFAATTARCESPPSTWTPWHATNINGRKVQACRHRLEGLGLCREEVVMRFLMKKRWMTLWASIVKKNGSKQCKKKRNQKRSSRIRRQAWRLSSPEAQWSQTFFIQLFCVSTIHYCRIPSIVTAKYISIFFMLGSERGFRILSCRTDVSVPCPHNS